MQNGNDKIYIEQKKLCYCYTYQCGVYVAGILILTELAFLICELIIIINNPYFESTYWIIYLLLLLPILAAAIIYVVYFFQQENPQVRACLPIALILAIVANVLLIIWIILYVCKVDHSNKVTVHKKIGFRDTLEGSQCRERPED